MRFIPLLFFAFLTSIVTSVTSKSPNILMIITDDMSTDIDPYIEATHPLHGKTPALDKLRSQSTVYMNAVPCIGVCAPSRACIWTGLRPDESKLYQFNQQLDGVMTIPRILKNQGYHTASFGKTFHYFGLKSNKAHMIPIYSKHWDYISFQGGEAGNSECKGKKVYCQYKRPGTLTDYRETNSVIKHLQALNGSAKPWFLAMGYRRPHIDLAVGKNSLSAINGKAVKAPDMTQIVPNNSIHYFRCQGLFNQWAPTYKNNLAFIRYYYASIKMIDGLIERLLTAADSVDPTTVVIFLSDHGFSLGHNNMWCKSTNFRRVTRVPLFIRTENKKPSVVNEMVELRALANYIVNYIPNTQLLTRPIAFSQYPACRPQGAVQDTNCMSPSSKADCSRMQLMKYAAHTTDGYTYMEGRPFYQKQCWVVDASTKTDWSGNAIEPILLFNNRNASVTDYQTVAPVLAKAIMNEFRPR